MLNIKLIKKIFRKLTPEKKKKFFGIGFGNKTALVSYLSDSYDFEDKYNQGRTNRVECSVIVSILNELGFVVDLVDCRDVSFSSDKKYDLVIGFGEPYRRSNSKNKILYLTEQPPKFSIEKEQERNDYYYERHNVKVKLQRSGVFYKDIDISMASKFIVLGNEAKANLIEYYKINHGSISVVKPSSIPTKIIKDNFGETNFLWLGSSGVIHKGLDLLCEVFSEIDNAKLFVAGELGKYKKLLKSSDSVEFIGFIDVNSKEYYDIVSKSSFVILPSCSEAVPTGILTAMHSGLIPVCSKVCDIEESYEYGMVLNDFHLESLKNDINILLSLDEELLVDKSKRVRDSAVHNYSIEKFYFSFKESLIKLV